MNDGTLLNLLVKLGKVPLTETQKILEKAKTAGSIKKAIVELGLLTEDELIDIISKYLKIQKFDGRVSSIDPKVLEILPADFVKKFRIIPISKMGKILRVLIDDPKSLAHLEDIKFLTGLNPEAHITRSSVVDALIERYYGGDFDLMTSTLENELVQVVGAGEEERVEKEIGEMIEEAPLVKFVNGIIINAVKKHASDIHIEPYEKVLRIRYRIDGVLQEISSLPVKLKDAIVSRIKIMSHLDIAEKRLPQDGHIKMKLPNGKTIDLRVSTLPTLFGEKVVMRVLDKSALTLDLSKLGFEERPLEEFMKAIRRPYGMVLVTGPTGSGKTTTLYSALSILNKPEVNIMTAEDPVEYDFPGINQVNIREDIGLTFAAALRAFLRQDPDIIMVGEIRDHETASIAIKAALTGHLVLSTLHTNDAPSAITRLIDMGIEPYLVASSLNLVVAQRLLRKICSNCKVSTEVHPEALREIGLDPEKVKDWTFYKGKGCSECNGTGYRGRIGIYEVLTITPEIREIILNKSPLNEIREKAIEQGMITLREAAILKMKRGLTTIDEVIRVTAEE